MDSSAAHSLEPDCSSSLASGSDEEEGEVLKVGENCVPQIELLKAVAQLKEEELVVKSSKGPLEYDPLTCWWCYMQP